MLNSGSAPANLEEEAMSTYRRLSTGSANNSPTPSPHTGLPKHVPGMVKERSADSQSMPSPSLKRKIDEVDVTSEHNNHTRRDAPSSDSSTIQKGSNASGNGVQKQRARHDLAYDGSKPLDELGRIIKSALMHYLTVDQRTYGKLGLEIEAKLGRILSKDTGRRMHDEFPFNSTTLLHQEYANIKFESNMTEQEHSKFNQHLNQEVETRNPKHPRFDVSRPKMTYEHTHLTDSIYESYREDGMEIRPRVTTNDKDGSVVEVISKEKIANLHICCPHYPFDIRLSINLEHQIPAPASGGSPVYERRKDRLSYKLATHRIDLTKVGDKAARTKAQSFELEVELTEMENLKRQAELELDERPNAFDDILTSFLSTIMTLNRTSTSFGQ